MSRFLFLIPFFFSAFSFSQFGNDWIDYGQQYFSFKIYKDGIYKIDYTQMNAAGMPLSSISPNNFQVFGFMKEQDILVVDGADGSFDPGDYILLQAEKNNTWLDSLMYDDPDDVLNKYYPLYNDTINYYLTWNSSVNNRRMKISNDVNFSSYAEQFFFYKTNYIESHGTYLEGYREEGGSNSTYVDGEGWSGGRYNANSAINYIDQNIKTDQAYSGSGAISPKVTAVICGASNASFDGGVGGNHHVRLEYGPSNTPVMDHIYTGYTRNKFEFDLPVAAMSSTNTRIRYQLLNDLGVASDYQSVPYTEITYARGLNLAGSSYFDGVVPHNSSQLKTRYNFNNFSSTTPWFLAKDEAGNITKCEIIESAGVYQVLVPNSENVSDQRFMIFDDSEINPISNLKAINGTGNFTDYSSYSYESAYLIISHPNLWTGALDYAAYRKSSAGGAKNVKVLDINELYHQFSGGVEKHVMAVRNFVKYAYETSSTKPEHLFIIGKGIREANEGAATGKGTRQSAGVYNLCLIPPFGYPASDILITARMGGSLWEPAVPIGRLAANTNSEVQIYLNKIIEFEEQQNPNSTYNVDEKLWQKQVLHFGGGTTSLEQNLFKNYLTNYENTIENDEFGGNVKAFYKTVSDPIDPVTLYEVNDYINEGVSIMTFFGHASADGFDQNVDDPENWNNQGKYPLVIGNACLTGDIFQSTNLSTSEEFVLIENKGSIAFLANVKQAYAYALNQYSDQLMKNISQKNYGESIGFQIKETVKSLESSTTNFGVRNVCLQMTLHGDPALRINSHEKPELEINESSLFITPAIVDLTVDSIDVNLVLFNLGKSTSDTFGIELRRFFPDGSDSLYSKQIYGIDYIDTIVFTIPFYSRSAVGINQFEIKVDQPSIIVEQYDEIANNQLSRQVIFDVDGIYPVYPYDYALVPEDTITLKGSTVNPFASMASYRFEVDTTDLFNSPAHRFSEVNSLGGVVEVKYNNWFNVASGVPNNLILKDSVVYFWRTAVTDSDSLFWIENSFQYIKGKSGWGQDHFFQFKNNQHTFLDYNRTARQRLFGNAFKTIECDVYGNANGFFPSAFTLYRIDGEIAEYNFCSTNPQILVCVIDPFTLEPWGTYFDDGTTVTNPAHNFGNANNDGGCRNRVEKHFSFAQNNPTQMASMQNMIENEIPDSHYVLIYTSRYANYSEWEPNAYSAFSNFGSDSIAPGKTEVPFILYKKMGNPSSFKEVYGSFLDELIQFEDTLFGYDYYGKETSTIIGPAQEWDKVFWKQHPLENPTEDSTRINIYGKNYAGTETLLIEQQFTLNDSIIDLSVQIDAAEYPFLRLEAELQDTVGFSPAQIDRWHVLYTPVPEAALDGSAGVYLVPGDTLYQGEKISVAFDVKNISDLSMDSLLIHYWIEDAEHNIIPIPYPRQDSLRVNETIRDTLTLPSVNFEGLSSLWVEVNPYTSFGKDQPEKYHFNNIGQIPFFTRIDEENPILDVTFNGQHLLNGDIIAPNSEILITLNDENPYLIMDAISDTANFGIYLTYPNGTQKRINFYNALGEEEMQWIPANSSNKKFKIIKNLDLSEDGTYNLLVQGADRSGNLSGDLEYQIEFEIDQTPSVTHLMNYPNPFSTSTQFVFTLTGNRVPDEFTIQIITVTGKMVREITVDELGPIHIGRNITSYTWDGRDEYGDILGNGVYLYRVITKINGESLEHRASEADQYFTKEFGKMYIIR